MNDFALTDSNHSTSSKLHKKKEREREPITGLNAAGCALVVKFVLLFVLAFLVLLSFSYDERSLRCFVARSDDACQAEEVKRFEFKDIFLCSQATINPWHFMDEITGEKIVTPENSE